MPRKVRQLRADLLRAGFVLERQVGSHQTWEHPSGASVTLAGKDGADARRYQERQVAEVIAEARSRERGKS